MLKKPPPSVLVFGATILGYGFAFSFEAGYLGRYQIGADFVQITPLQIVTGAFVVLSAIALYDLILSIIAEVSSQYDKNNVLHRARLEFAIITSLLVVAFLVLPNSLKITSLSESTNKLWVLSVAVLIYLLVLFLNFYYTVVAFAKTKNLHKSLAAGYKIRDQKSEKTPLPQKTPRTSLKLRLIPLFFKPLVIVVALFLVCGLIGHLSANYKNKFVTVVQSQGPIKQIVVRQYGNTLLLKDFDTKKRILKNGFSIKEAVNNRYVAAVLDCTSDYKSNQGGDPQVKKLCP